MIDEGWKEDPEVGLGYDPILSAQDYPDKGFEFDSIDQNNNCVFLKGKGEAQFKVVVRVVEKNSKWLVDGAGIVNMPNL